MHVYPELPLAHAGAESVTMKAALLNADLCRQYSQTLSL